MKNALWFLLFCWLLSIHRIGYAEIKETSSMDEVFKDATPDTLVLFDLDNTLMQPPQTLGSDQWVDYLRAKFTQQLVLKGVGQAEAEKQAMTEALSRWKAVQKVTAMKLVEKGVPEKIRALQDRGTRTMGLTARTVDMAEATLQQLKSLGIDLAHRSLSTQDVLLRANSDVDFAAKYTQGLLISGLNKKGEMLVRFLRNLKNPFKPKKIIFVDDKLVNCQSVESSLEKVGVPHTSFRYGVTDPVVKSFNKDIAELQWLFFGGILTDDAARAVLDRHQAE